MTNPDYETIDALITEHLGEPDDVFGKYHLDCGELQSFIAKCFEELTKMDYMTNPKLITDEIVEKACKGYDAARGLDTSHKKKIKAAILAIQDDITRPVYNILQGYKRDAQAKALKGEYHEPREE